MKKPTLIIIAFIFLGLFAVPVIAQKTVNVVLEKNVEENYWGASVIATGKTTFAVKLKKGQKFSATAVIKSNKSKMPGIMYSKTKGQILDDDVTVGRGSFSNQFSGYADRTTTYYFEITERPGAKFEFAIKVENPK